MRRFFILDANIDGEMNVDVTKEMPKFESDGLPVYLPYHGGNRRVDSICSLILFYTFSFKS